jgi:hypothetical protein
MNSFLKFFTALHVSAYSAIIRCAEIQGEMLCLPRYRNRRSHIYNDTS